MTLFEAGSIVLLKSSLKLKSGGFPHHYNTKVLRLAFSITIDRKNIVLALI